MFKPLIGALALAVSATAVNAETLTIRSDDLDLSTVEGMTTLDRRIMAGARQVCDSNRTTTGTRIQSKSATDCVKRATAQAREKFAALQVKPTS